jgi:hypothetical protein
MQVTQIKVSAGRTFNHPFESYSNLRCDVHLDAHLSEGEDPKAATQVLQAQAEELAEGHKQNLIKQIHDLEELARATREISALEDRITTAQAQLNRLRDSRAALSAPGVVTPNYSYPAGADKDPDDDDLDRVF